MYRNNFCLLFFVLLFNTAAFAQKPAAVPSGTQTATFGMGCFWCSEAIFTRLKGVVKVESGFSGGTVKNPSYEQVCTGETGHAEVVQVSFDPKVISYADLLEVFWKMHDPTTLNRQGEDEGTQYRSVIFYRDAAQKTEAEKYKAALNQAKAYPNPIVTQIVPFQAFYKAEDYHQNYFALNGRKPYCRLVILPKVQKLEEVFKSKLKSN
ncbi:peptide-methionine (S)-S-oxide reductase MsrA [Mucilaginibacter sp. SP1R1]|uniref:peptide-methionine (S)-S-oxide reductase MsrA n=1 Tax=Mucilaginibacter sp. SP1R1 TaxID=2723091 RepID=UPI00161944E0|nr:peptide-methionine (S)-S-oxide reductase MsrA [Mucilaginibacter sp. SP1R1]MBB6150648.1 peptide-methionine (S)-S-oxide reductase [Mucilaginibacter sp. SP1R1]